MAGSKLKIDIRRSKILQQLRLNGKVSVTELSVSLGTTPVTIRSDLSALERDGLILRVQGGAVLLGSGGEEPVPEPRDVEQLEQKRAIARAVVARIRDGDTLFMNSGTTTYCVAEALRQRKNLNVVTNSLAVATLLGTVPTIRVVLLGGEINAAYGFTYGSDTQEQLSAYQAQWAVLSVEGVSRRAGITTHHAEEAIIDRMMITGARAVLIAADHRKIGRVGFARVCERGENITLLTDSDAPESAMEELRDYGWEIQCAGINEIY